MRAVTLFVICWTLFVSGCLLLTPAEAWAQDASQVSAETTETTEEPIETPDKPDKKIEEMAKKENVELSPAIVQKLSAKQLERVIQHRDTMRSGIGRRKKEWVAILVPLFFFLCLGGIVGGTLYYRNRQSAHRHQTLRLMIEQGAEIPPELLTPPIKPRSDLRRGILLIAGGIGATVFLALVNSDEPGVWSLGLIPTLIGIGYLIAWKLEPGRTNGNGNGNGPA
jgi:hypothetical protein